MSGSLAITSIRKPSGNLNAAALCSGVMGLGASVGCGICASARLVAKSIQHATAATLSIARHAISECIGTTSSEAETVDTRASYQ